MEIGNFTQVWRTERVDGGREGRREAPPPSHLPPPLSAATLGVPFLWCDLRMSRHSYDRFGDSAEATMPISSGAGGSWNVTVDSLQELNEKCQHNPSALVQYGGIERLIQDLKTDPERGLSRAELQSKCADRKRAFGDNVPPEAPRKTLLGIFIGSLGDPMLIALIVVAILSILIGVFAPHEDDGGGGWYEGAAILAAVAIVSLVSTYNDYDKDRRFRALNATKQNFDVKVIRDGVDMILPTFELCVGDVVRLGTGDAVPADGLLLGGYNVEVNQSTMTGETNAVKKRGAPKAAGGGDGGAAAGVSPPGSAPAGASLGAASGSGGAARSEGSSDFDCFMISGTVVQNGTGTMIVTAVGANSELGRMLAKLMEDEVETPLQQKLGALAAMIGYVGMGAAILTFVALLATYFVDVHTGNKVKENLRAVLVTPTSMPGPTMTVVPAAPAPPVAADPAPVAVPVVTKTPAAPVAAPTPQPPTHTPRLVNDARAGAFLPAPVPVGLSSSQTHHAVTDARAAATLAAPKKGGGNVPVPAVGGATPVPTVTNLVPGYLLGGRWLDDLTPQEYRAANLYIDEVVEVPRAELLDIVMKVVDAILIAITIVVVAVPEGLPLAVTISLAYSVAKMLQDQALVRKLQACETMGCATTICSDKTGTLTLNRMTVTEAWVGGEDACPPRNGLPVPLLQNIAVNSTANVVEPDGGDVVGAGLGGNAATPGGNVVYQGAPTEGAMLLLLNRVHSEAYSAIRRAEQKNVVMVWPFDSKVKCMSTALRVSGRGGTGSLISTPGAPVSEGGPVVRILLKGASELMLARCNQYQVDSKTVKPLDAATRSAVEESISRFANNGLRTLICAYQDLSADQAGQYAQGETPPPKDGYVLSALFGIKDPIRPQVPDSVERCRKAGIVVRMVTGDNLTTAEHICKDAGILPQGPTPPGSVMEGAEFRNLSDAQMLSVLPSLRCLARSSPTDKHLLVSRLQAMGNVVAVTGDGVNDSPALKKADVGLAMGSGTEVAKEASDIVVMDDNFESIVRAVVWGRSVYANIRRFLQFQVTVNVSALIVTFITAFTESGPPLTALQLLWVNVIMDSFAALALATEPPTNDLLDKSPADYKDLITPKMYKHILVQGIYQVVILLGFFFALEQRRLDDVVVPHHVAETEHDDQVRSLVFNTFVLCQVFNELNCRKVEDEINIFAGLLKARMFALIIVVTVVFQIIFITFVPTAIAKTVPLSLEQWGICVAIGAFSIPLGTLTRLLPLEKLVCCGDDEDEDEGVEGGGGDPERERLIAELEEAKKEIAALKQSSSSSRGARGRGASGNIPVSPSPMSAGAAGETGGDSLRAPSLQHPPRSPTGTGDGPAGPSGKANVFSEGMAGGGAGSMLALQSPNTTPSSATAAAPSGTVVAAGPGPEDAPGGAAGGIGGASGVTKALRAPTPPPEGQ